MCIATRVLQQIVLLSATVVYVTLGGTEITFVIQKKHYTLTRNYCENNSLRMFFVIFEGNCALNISGKERHFPEITREIRNFSKMIISEYFFS